MPLKDRREMITRVWQRKPLAIAAELTPVKGKGEKQDWECKSLDWRGQILNNLVGAPEQRLSTEGSALGTDVQALVPLTGSVSGLSVRFIWWFLSWLKVWAAHLHMSQSPFFVPYTFWQQLLQGFTGQLFLRGNMRGQRVGYMITLINGSFLVLTTFLIH